MRERSTPPWTRVDLPPSWQRPPRPQRSSPAPSACGNAVPDAQQRAGLSRDDVLYDAIWELGNSANVRQVLGLLDAELARLEDTPIRRLCVHLARNGHAQTLGAAVDAGLYEGALRHVDDLLSAPSTSLTMMGLQELSWYVMFTHPDLSRRLDERALVWPETSVTAGSCASP